MRSWRPFDGAQDMLGGRKSPKITLRKGAKRAKFGNIKAGAAKKIWLGGGGTFAYLASWRENNSEEVSRAKTQRAPSSEKLKQGREEKPVRRLGLCELGVLAGEKDLLEERQSSRRVGLTSPFESRSAHRASSGKKSANAQWREPFELIPTA